ncbi:hypothetical protein OAU77_00875 [Gammaproteobacteria bacterium]|nr:hypothetical protein [Gammaproteobacteria bacterium]
MVLKNKFSIQNIMGYKLRSFAVFVVLSAISCQPVDDISEDLPSDLSEFGKPLFSIDSGWPQVPVQWRLGEVSSIALDSDDNAWFLHRPWTLTESEASMAAPQILGFDSAGSFLAAWGGPGNGYEWPQREHGLHIDHQGFFWIGGNNCPVQNEPGLDPISDDQVLKFLPDGTFVMQIGNSNSSTGNSDIVNLNRPADAVVYAPTNEVFVADGYGNHRVAIFDADTGIFKRMWGAFGNTPEDNEQCPYVFLDSVPDGPGPSQFSIVHAIRISNDGLVYVADRENRRIQIFSLDGRYVDQIIQHDTPFARNIALSPDEEQQFLYVGGGPGIMVFNRLSLQFLTSIETTVGTGHHIQTDSQGNIYIAATGVGYERLIYMGLSSELPD